MSLPDGCRLLLLCALPAWLIGQTPKTFPCEAPGVIRDAIREANRVETEKDGNPRPFEQVRKEQQERVKALRAKYPDDFWVLDTYSRVMKDGPAASDELVAEFRKRHESQPGDPEAAYLYASVLVGKDTPKAIEILSGLIEQAPSFPRPWLTLHDLLVSEFQRPGQDEVLCGGLSGALSGRQ